MNKRFEHNFFHLNSESEVIETLPQMENQGWELLSCQFSESNDCFYLTWKRPNPNARLSK